MVSKYVSAFLEGQSAFGRLLVEFGSVYICPTVHDGSSSIILFGLRDLRM